MGKDLSGKELGDNFGQRRNGQYYARYKNRFGERRTIYDRNYKALKVLYNQAIFEDKREMNVVDAGTTLDEWYEKWMKIHKHGVIRENTRHGYNFVYKKSISPVLGQKKLTEITNLMIKSLINEMDSAGYGYESKNKVRKMLSDMYDKALIDNFVLRNPAKGIKLKNEEEKEIKALSKEEQVIFFECSAGTYYHNLFVVAVETGLRPGELYALTWDDIDLEKKIIRVNKTLIYQKYEGDASKSYHFGPPKTKNSNRTVQMTKKCELAIIKQKMQCDIIMKKRKAKPIEGFEKLLFITTLGTPLNTTTYSDAIRKIVDEINLCRDDLEKMEYFSGHCFRHTFATRCFEAGIKPKTVQGYLGHASLQMTMDLYTHVFVDHSKEELEKLELLEEGMITVDELVERQYQEYACNN